MITFNATCPNGHTGPQRFYKERLSALVDGNGLRLWCTKCDAQWQASGDDLDQLRRILRIQE